MKSEKCTSLRRKIKTFLKESVSGSVAIPAALLSIPIFLSAGIAVDYSRLYNIKEDMQNAADAAALAAAQQSDSMSRRELNRFVKRFFRANGAGSEIERARRIRGRYVDTNVVVRARIDADLYFLGLMRKKGSRIDVISEATRSATGVELAMVIDNTTSMSFGSTWGNTTRSVENVFEEISDQTLSDEFFVTVIPYTDRVNISEDRSDWLIQPGSEKFELITGEGDEEDQEEIWEDALEDWEGCVEPTEKAVSGYEFNLELGDANGFYVPSVEGLWEGVRKDRAHHSDCAEPIIGPTNDFEKVVREFANIRPKRATGRFDDALIWGWRAVSEEYRGQWGAGIDYPSENNDRKKIVALFTDGRTNINEYEMERKRGEFGHNNGSRTLFSHVLQVCDRMKQDGVVPFIFHIVGNSHAKPYFEDCAGENYYEIRNVPEFQSALGNLGKVGGSVRLVR